jgi:hypothetical protein
MSSLGIFFFSTLLAVTYPLGVISDTISSQEVSEQRNAPHMHHKGSAISPKYRPKLGARALLAWNILFWGGCTLVTIKAIHTAYRKSYYEPHVPVIVPIPQTAYLSAIPSPAAVADLMHEMAAVGKIADIMGDMQNKTTTIEQKNMHAIHLFNIIQKNAMCIGSEQYSYYASLVQNAPWVKEHIHNTGHIPHVVDLLRKAETSRLRQALVEDNPRLVSRGYYGFAGKRYYFTADDAPFAPMRIGNRIAYTANPLSFQAFIAKDFAVPAVKRDFNTIVNSVLDPFLGYHRTTEGKWAFLFDLNSGDIYQEPTIVLESVYEKLVAAQIPAIMPVLNMFFATEHARALIEYPQKPFDLGPVCTDRNHVRHINGQDYPYDAPTNSYVAPSYRYGFDGAVCLPKLRVCRSETYGFGLIPSEASKDATIIGLTGPSLETYHGINEDQAWQDFLKKLNGYFQYFFSAAAASECTHLMLGEPIWGKIPETATPGRFSRSNVKKIVESTIESQLKSYAGYFKEITYFESQKSVVN